MAMMGAQGGGGALCVQRLTSAPPATLGTFLSIPVDGAVSVSFMMESGGSETSGIPGWDTPQLLPRVCQP